MFVKPLPKLLLKAELPTSSPGSSPQCFIIPDNDWGEEVWELILFKGCWAASSWRSQAWDHQNKKSDYKCMCHRFSWLRRSIECSKSKIKSCWLIYFVLYFFGVKNVFPVEHIDFTKELLKKTKKPHQKTTKTKQQQQQQKPTTKKKLLHNETSPHT